MENLISARINFLAERQEILSNTQHGFRSGRSTLDPIVELEYEIRKGMVEGDVTIVVFFDLKAAFDSVDHTILLHSSKTGTRRETTYLDRGLHKVQIHQNHN